MRIALIAHDSRKELLAQFCTAYVRILSQNELVATGVTGKVVHDACGLPVRCLYPGARGGAEQISSMIACGEIDMLLFFRDPANARPNEPNAVTLLRLCDTRAIPVATNIAPAEVLIHGLARGDLAGFEVQGGSICRISPKPRRALGGHRALPHQPHVRVYPYVSLQNIDIFRATRFHKYKKHVLFPPLSGGKSHALFYSIASVIFQVIFSAR